MKGSKIRQESIELACFPYIGALFLWGFFVFVFFLKKNEDNAPTHLRSTTPMIKWYSLKFRCIFFQGQERRKISLGTKNLGIDDAKLIEMAIVEGDASCSLLYVLSSISACFLVTIALLSGLFFTASLFRI